MGVVTNTELTQTSLETGFGVRIKRLKSRVLVQKPGFCVSPKTVEFYILNSRGLP